MPLCHITMFVAFCVELHNFQLKNLRTNEYPLPSYIVHLVTKLQLSSECSGVIVSNRFLLCAYIVLLNFACALSTRGTPLFAFVGYLCFWNNMIKVNYLLLFQLLRIALVSKHKRITLHFFRFLFNSCFVKGVTYSIIVAKVYFIAKLKQRLAARQIWLVGMFSWFPIWF